MRSLNIFLYLQAACTVVALVLNSFLIYVIAYHTKSKIGFYKYILISFAVFEMVYAIIVLVGMPINFIADSSWIVFNHDGIIGNTSFNWLGPGLYCTFYELWMGFVVVHFVYRYVVVCREGWKIKIQESGWLKFAIVIVYLCHVSYSIICGMFFCTRSQISKELTSIIGEEFQVSDPTKIGYILLRVKTLEGEYSPGGITSIIDHYVLVAGSIVIIFCCGFQIWRTIGRMQKDVVQLREVNLQRQMFITLVIQTVIPLFLCHVPSLIYLSFPFWDKKFTFGAISPIFSFLTAVPKVLDPIVVMICIREYRRAVAKMFCGGKESRIGMLTTTGATPSTNGSDSNNDTSNRF